MTSPAPPTDPAALYADLERATQLMAVSDDVPDDVEELIRNFDETLHAASPQRGLASIDPYIGEALLGGALVCAKGLLDENTDRRRRRVRIGLEQVRQALRDALDEGPSLDEPPRDLVRRLADMTGASQSTLAELLGVSPRTVQRWLSAKGGAQPEGSDAARLFVIVRVANHLQHVFTGPGVVRWFQRPHPSLGGRTPASLLEDPIEYPRVTELAARARSTVAS